MVEFKKISSGYLVPSDVPGVGADWNEIVVFSSTFDLAEMHYGQLASRELSSIDQNASLIELRSLLFYQWRRWNHFGRPPETGDMTGIHHLIECIRAHVESQ